MRKKQPLARYPLRQPDAIALKMFSYVPPGDLFLYARAFHNAAKALAASFQPKANPFRAVDASPIFFMYRHAVELHLKAIVLGEGSNFLETKPDGLSIQKTHSVSWLAQFVAQIITALAWEGEFRCEGVQSLGDFKAMIEELNAVDPGTYVFRSPVDPRSETGVRDFALKVDAVLGLLASTADGLAAEWDLRHGPGDDWKARGSKPTVH